MLTASIAIFEQVNSHLPVSVSLLTGIIIILTCCEHLWRYSENEFPDNTAKDRGKKAEECTHDLIITFLA